jgi:molybdopterin molybdotransferase
MQELAAEDARTKTLTVKERPEAGQHVRRRGEDLKAGETVCAEGSRVRPAELAALAAVGRTRVRVIPAPSVAVLSTGDELVEVAAAPRPHQVRNSNAAMLAASLRSMGVTPLELGIAGDDTAELDAAVATGLRAEVFLLTGGVSVGAYDLVAAALSRAGCEILFHNVAMRPGKPILAARRGRCLVFGLPGNPVSAFTGFQVFVAPAVRKLMGEPNPAAALVRARLDAPLRRRPGRLTFHLARLRHAGGEPFVSPVASASSGDVLSLVRANAFIVAPGDPQAIAAGESVDVLSWD